MWHAVLGVWGVWEAEGLPSQSPIPITEEQWIGDSSIHMQAQERREVHLAHNTHSGRASSQDNSITGQMGNKILFKLGLQQESHVNWINCPDWKCHLISNNKIVDPLNMVRALYTSNQYAGSPKHRGCPLSQTCCNQTVWYPEFKQQVRSCRSC